MSKLFVSAVAAFSALFAPVAGAINGALIPAEIGRAVAAGMAATSATAGIAAGLNVIAGDSALLTGNQALASVLAFVFAHLAALVLQLGQSKAPTPAK